MVLFGRSVRDVAKLVVQRSHGREISPVSRCRKEVEPKNYRDLYDGYRSEQSGARPGDGQEQTAVLDSEDDISILMEFVLYELLQGGKTLVQKYHDEHGGTDEVERDLLDAMARAKTGLFKVERIWKQKRMLDLQELAGERRTVSLVDIGFSQSSVQDLILFFRPIRLAEFTMSSGIAFVFPQDMEQKLVRRWGKWSSAERYAGYFRMSKSNGIPMEYV